MNSLVTGKDHPLTNLNKLFDEICYSKSTFTTLSKQRQN